MVSLHSFMLVLTSSVARTVLQYFSDHQIGLVTCNIVQECLPSLQLSPPDPNSLVNFVEVRDPCFQPVLERLLGRWILVEDRFQAVEAIMNQKQKTQNFVTKIGELFLSNGVVKNCPNVLPELQKCFLGTQFQSMTDSNLLTSSKTESNESGEGIEDLQGLDQKLQNQALRIKSKIRELRRSITEKEARILEQEKALSLTKTELESKQKPLSRLSAKHAVLVKELEDLNLDSLIDDLTLLKVRTSFACFAWKMSCRRNTEL